MKATLYLLLSLAAPLWADFKSGLAAYDRADFPAALQEWLPVAERGDANAQFNVGLLYATGKGVKKDPRLAAEWYRKAADQGVGAAQYNLGVMYANGEGLPRDVHEAVKWLQKAADAGIPMGREELANLYGSKGIENYSKSVETYSQVADKGSPTAQFDLALLYDLGRGVPRNYEEAMKWYRKAADQGYPPAMTNIGILYYNQEGVTRDLVEAYAWFVRAKLAGDPRAADLLQMTMDKLKGDQIRQGEALAANWHPQKPSPAAQVDMASLEARLFKQPGPGASINVTAGQTSNQARGEASRQSTPISTVTGVQRVVAIGDSDGKVEPFLRTLQSASIVDADGRWVGGRSHLVVTADRVEGPFADLMNRLQGQAESARGGVHVLVGPEAGVKINDTLFLHEASYASESDLEAAMRDYGVWRVVLGHGNGDSGIMPRYHGKLIINDDPQREGCLVIEYGKPYALYRGRGLALPVDDSADLERYRRQVDGASVR
jgi:TPR repeat protein